ncbi:MAG: adenylate/guanylate cyclase domain-containing protein [Dongiaceae bacterium]
MERKLTAILAADIAGYSRLMGADEEGTLDALRAHRDVVDGLVAAHRGRVFNSAGDSIVAEFPSAVEAINCAAEIQREMGARNAPVAQDRRLEFRIGINIGDVMAEGGNLFGDGVNVAARVQELAEPGGICVARNVYDQVKQKVGVAFEPLGNHQVKNIAEPVAIYRVLTDGAARRSPMRRWLSGAPRQRLATATLVLLLAISVGGAATWYFHPRPPAPSGPPSIAVLPFANMSGDPAQDYLGAGVAEEIITMLSSYPGVRVTSRTSSFVYDGPVKVQQVAQDLGVAYVLEGSVKKSAASVHVTAQLIDATTGDHVWAERFEDEGSDVVALQVDVASRIFDSIAGIRGEIRKKEEEDAWRKSAPSLEEYDYYLRGNQFFFRPGGDGTAKARATFEEGLARFPESALLRLKIASTYWADIERSQSDDPWRDVALGWKLIKETESIPDKSRFETWLYHWQMAGYYQFHDGDFERSAAAAEAAVKLVPNDPFELAVLAGIMTRAGRTDRAIEWAQQAVRDPNAIGFFHDQLGWAYYHADRPSDALSAFDEAQDSWGKAVAYARLGRMDEAQVLMAESLKDYPGATVAAEAVWPTGKQPQMVERLLTPYLEDLRKAGLPEN